MKNKDFLLVKIITFIIYIYSLLHKNKLLRIKKYSKCEAKTRKIFEEIFKTQFNTIRPNFLKNPETKRNLELDGYSKIFNLAFEVNGRQHYRYSPHFHTSPGNFIKQVRRDIFKEEKCKKLFIVLVNIPYDVGLRNLEKYIIGKIGRSGLFNLQIYLYKQKKNYRF